MTCLKANLGLFFGAILCSPRATLGVAPTKPFAATRFCVEVAVGVTPTFSFGTIWFCPKTSFDPWEALRQLGIVLGVILYSWAIATGKIFNVMTLEFLEFTI
jgi:hypothetical protein